MFIKSLAALSLAMFPITVFAQASLQGEHVAMSTIPFRLEESFGSLRTMVDVSINGHPFRMMIHSNADHSQLTHAEAALFGISDVEEQEKKYGIVSPGKLSTLGRGVGHIDRLQVGGSAYRNVRVSVFEIPQNDRGMLGIDWIGPNRVILDYDTRRATLDPTPAFVEAMRSRLLATGYKAIPMTFDESMHRFTIPTTIGKATRNMTVGSATSSELDTGMADVAGVARGKLRGTANGPRGSVIPIYHTAGAVTLVFGSWTSPPMTGFSIDDIYAYMSVPRPLDPATPHGGTLGSDFLAATHAVVDFGSKVLYVK